MPKIEIVDIKLKGEFGIVTSVEESMKEPVRKLINFGLKYLKAKALKEGIDMRDEKDEL